MRLYIVDAFTEKVFGGNPAGVVIVPIDGEYPPDSVMKNVAAELRYSETAFVQKIDEGRFKLRYFTPTEEVDLCGHATVAAFCAMLDDGQVINNSDYTAETAAGSLNISIGEGLIMMDMAPPEHIKTIQNGGVLKELYNVMGLGEEVDRAFSEIGRVSLEGEWDLYPEIISTGLPDIILPVLNRTDLEKIKPDYPALAELTKHHGAIGVHAFTPGEGLIGSDCDEGACDLSQVTAYCRNFAPAVGIDEEAATGTANGALTYYLYKNALIDEGTSCKFIQGEAMNRPSIIMSTINADESGLKIRVGGTGTILARGNIYAGGPSL